MATEKEKQQHKKAESEAARRKKEEQARKSRRRSRQWIGVVLAALIVVGAISIVRSAIGLVQGITDNTEEKAEFEGRIRYMVWFDMLPFNSVGQADPEAIKQVAIWSIVDPNVPENKLNLETNDLGELLVPAADVDHWAASLFGPSFVFETHGSFTDATQALRYEYDSAREAYVVPSTGLEPTYDATVVDIKNEQSGIKRVTVGYVEMRRTDGTVITTPDREHPVRYMDYLFQRDGNQYYLYAIVQNTTHIVTTATSQSQAQQPTSVYTPVDDTSIITPTSIPEDTSAPTEEGSVEGDGDTSTQDGSGDASASSTAESAA